MQKSSRINIMLTILLSAVAYYYLAKSSYEDASKNVGSTCKQGTTPVFEMKLFGWSSKFNLRLIFSRDNLS